MSFNLEWKISWDELAPSLQELFKNLQTQVSNSTSNYESIKNQVIENTKNINNLTVQVDKNTTNIKNNTNNISNINKQITVINNNITNMGDVTEENIKQEISDTKQYADAKDFLNFDPKIGFFDEKTVPIFANYNMNYIGVNVKAFCVSDSLGREVVYYGASNGVDEYSKIYRATRLNDNDSFVFENEPIKPAYMNKDDFPIEPLALGTYFILYSCMIGSAIRYHLVITNGSSNASRWTTYYDVTNALTSMGNLFGAHYFQEYNTFMLIGHQWNQPVIDIWNLNNMTRLASRTMSNIWNMFRSNIVDFNNGGSLRVWTHFCWSACYIEEYGEIYYRLNEYMGHFASDGYSYGNIHYTIIQRYKIPESFKRNGTGTITEVYGPNDYYFSNDRYQGDTVDRNKPWAIFSGNYLREMAYAAYDSFDLTVRHCSCYWQQSDVFMVRKVASEMPRDGLWGSTFDNRVNIRSTDSCPWGKLVIAALFIDNRLFIIGSSKQYGNNQTIYSECRFKNGIIEPIPGTWVIQDIGYINNYYIYSVRMSNTRTLTVWMKNGQDCREVLFNTTTKQLYFDDNNLLANKIFDDSWMANKQILHTRYNPKSDSMLYIVRNANTKRAYIVVYYFSTQTVKYFNDFSIYPSDFINRCDNATDLTIQREGIIDTDNSVNILIMFSYPTSWPYFVMIVRFNSDSTSISRIDWRGSWNNGYNQLNMTPSLYSDNVGYQRREYGNGAAKYTLTTFSKNPENSSSRQFTFDEFFMNDNLYKTYTYKLTVKSSSGLVAYIQDTPIFLGGYYSTIPAQQIMLYPNCDNYVYLIRDRADRTKVNIMVRKDMIGIRGENGFNRILATRIKTNSTDPIEQEYFPLESLSG